MIIEISTPQSPSVEMLLFHFGCCSLCLYYSLSLLVCLFCLYWTRSFSRCWLLFRHLSLSLALSASHGCSLQFCLLFLARFSSNAIRCKYASFAYSWHISLRIVVRDYFTSIVYSWLLPLYVVVRSYFASYCQPSLVLTLCLSHFLFVLCQSTVLCMWNSLGYYWLT